MYRVAQVVPAPTVANGLPEKGMGLVMLPFERQVNRIKLLSRDLCTSRNFSLWQGKNPRKEGVYGQ